MNDEIEKINWLAVGFCHAMSWYAYFCLRKRYMCSNTITIYERAISWAREQSAIHTLYDVYVPYELKLSKPTDSSVKHKMTIKLNCPDIMRVILDIFENYMCFPFNRPLHDPIGILKKLQHPNNEFSFDFLFTFELGAINFISCGHCSSYRYFLIVNKTKNDLDFFHIDEALQQ